MNFGSSPPGFLCSAGCAKDYFIDFGAPVEQLTLSAVGVNDTGSIGLVRVFQNGVPATATSIMGLGDESKPVPIDLTMFHSVTRVEVTMITDFSGFGLDDIAFQSPT